MLCDYGIGLSEIFVGSELKIFSLIQMFDDAMQPRPGSALFEASDQSVVHPGREHDRDRSQGDPRQQPVVRSERRLPSARGHLAFDFTCLWRTKTTQFGQNHVNHNRN